MKTLESIKAELGVARKLAEKQLSKSEEKRLDKELKMLYQCQLYLETEPTKTFLEKQKTEVTRKIKIVNEGFDVWMRNNQKECDGVKNPKSKYYSLMGMKTLKLQLNTLNFLLMV